MNSTGNSFEIRWMNPAIRGAAAVLTLFTAIFIVRYAAGGRLDTGEFVRAMAVPCVLMGFVLFGCRGVRFELEGRTAYSWWGLHLPRAGSLRLPGRRIPIGRCAFTTYVGPAGGHDSGTGGSRGRVFRVELRDDEVELLLSCLATPFRVVARKAAKNLARFLSVPFVEDLDQDLLTLYPEEIDMPLGRRLLKLRAQPPAPEAPSTLRLRGGLRRRIIIRLPRPPARRDLMGIALFGLIPTVLLFYARLKELRLLPGVDLIAPAVTVLFVLPLVHALTLRIRFTLSEKKLTVTRRFFGVIPWKRSIRLDELDFVAEVIRGIRSGSAEGICLRAAGPRAVIDFAFDLAAEERAYLRDLIIHKAAVIGAQATSDLPHCPSGDSQ